MEDFLENIQLLQRKQIKLPVGKTEFIKHFTEHVDEGEIGLFSGMFEAFSSSNNKFKGKISNNEFEIRKRKQLFDKNNFMARVKGTFRQQADHLVIDVEINGFSKVLIPFYIIITIFYIFFIYLYTSSLQHLDSSFLFIIFHAILMYGVPYFVMRRKVKNATIEIEKELFFMTRKDPYNL